MKFTHRLFATGLSAGLAASLGCQPAEPPVAEAPAIEAPRQPLEEEAPVAPETDPPAEALDPDEAGLDAGLDDAEPQTPASESPAPEVELPETLPTIEELPALSNETPVDEGTKLPFAPVGELKVRDGVYVLRLHADAGGSREIVMTVETQANGFLARRGDQTRLRFVIDDQGVAFASEPGSAEIGGRGVASGDDWIRGAYRTKSDDGAVAAGQFELRKLFDPKTPRGSNQP